MGGGENRGRLALKEFNVVYAITSDVASGEK